MREVRPLILLLLLLLFIVACAASLLTGSIYIPFSSLVSEHLRSILLLRLSRILLSAVAGASLAVVGAVLQGLLKNPLADPYVLGISSGSGLFAVLGIVLGLNATFGIFAVPLSAFVGGVATILFVYFLSKRGPKVTTEDLLLSGVIMSAMLSSFIMFFVSVLEVEGLHSALWWLLGNTQIFDMGLLSIVVSVCVGGMLLCALLGRNLNVMSLGEEEAISLGMDVEKVKMIFFIITSLITAAVVSVCGLIGFVGLIIPHVGRRFVGPDHRYLIPASALAGAIFMVLCDIAARRIMPPLELPVGVITAMIGGPFFILLLKRARKSGYRL